MRYGFRSLRPTITDPTDPAFDPLGPEKRADLRHTATGSGPAPTEPPAPSVPRKRCFDTAPLGLVRRDENEPGLMRAIRDVRDSHLQQAGQADAAMQALREGRTVAEALAILHGRLAA